MSMHLVTSTQSSVMAEKQGKYLFITNAQEEPLVGHCFFFVRHSNEKAIKPDNVHKDAYFGCFEVEDGDVLGAVQFYMSKIMLPALKATSNWGQLTGQRLEQYRGRFLEEVETFIECLGNARTSVKEQQIKLTHIDVNVDITSMSPGQYASLGSDPTVIENLEKQLEVWMKEIDQILVVSEQIQCEADDIGPSAELDHWKRRTARFDCLLSEIRKPRIRAITAALHALKSKSIKKWREIDSMITDATNEAKDNVRYLYTLDKFFGPLVKCSPCSLIDHIPNLLNTVRMIYSISQFYNTSERMTSLFVKITNQMVSSSKVYMYQGVTKIWDHPREELVSRINDCLKLNEAYQNRFQATKQKLRENPKEPQFEFSENYIFGRFDTFCARLLQIREMATTLEALSCLPHIRLQGMESYVAKYKAIIATVKKKSYDHLNHRCREFREDYDDFMNQISSIREGIQGLVELCFSRTLPAAQAVSTLEKFAEIKGIELDLWDKYMRVLLLFGKEVEVMKKTYQKQKEDPPIARNMPPISGRILWSRQLYTHLEISMLALARNKDLMRTPEARKVVKNYNKVAAALTEYEILFHRAWARGVEGIMSGLKASILVRHPETRELFVNFDPRVYELLCETRHMVGLKLEVPDLAFKLLAIDSEKLKFYAATLTDMLKEHKSLIEEIPPILTHASSNHVTQLDEIFIPGLTRINWCSLNIEKFISGVEDRVGEFKLFVKQLSDTIECRINTILDEIISIPLVVIPDGEPLHINEFVEMTEIACSKGIENLSRLTSVMEQCVDELIEILKSKLKPSDIGVLVEPYYCTHHEAKLKGQRCQECLSCIYFNTLHLFAQKNTDALTRCLRDSLDRIKKRLRVKSSSSDYGSTSSTPTTPNPPILKTDIILALPNIVIKPSLDEIQHSLNKISQSIVQSCKAIPQWRHSIFAQHELEQQVQGDGEVTSPGPHKHTNKALCDNKEIVKIMSQLNTLIGSLKSECGKVLQRVTSGVDYSEIWEKDADGKLQVFKEHGPSLAEYQDQIRYYHKLEERIESIPSSLVDGPILFSTEQFKYALKMECRAAKVAFGRELNHTAGDLMEDIFTFVENVGKGFNRSLNDLDDVRTSMTCLEELRNNEIRLDGCIGPLEEAYALLNKMELTFDDGNAERVDTLGYSWKTVMQQSREAQENLLIVQPQFRSDLLSGVEQYIEDVLIFETDYLERGPNIQGVPPQEASERLTIFQIRFDDLWRKYNTYSAGEELFGLSKTDYPALYKIKKELNLLSKLYTLYNAVNDSVDGYYDIMWQELDIEAVNSELVEFQNKCRKLPRGLKEWKAFLDLKRKIDDFNECCPLLEMMANKAMKSRHWDRITAITNHKFDVESDNFLLRHIMEAPILPNKNDIEDICISATKEKDIEAKLKVIIAEWEGQNFTFSTFKSRGELLLKGQDVQELVALLEDSLMVLASLLSNRYNVPFKPKIQLWVNKLSGTTEIIEQWMTVQNLWIYLEAVFVGGDIAKQLPQEAKRFSNIDKSWQKIMQRAHETTNVVQCCVGDDTLDQLLPHLLEQLEICQKSLTGYLEKKRLVFPRFFFVSDPALLEILGQASNSHSIQAHLVGVFDNVCTATFHEKDYDKIIGVNSREKEHIDLEKFVMAQGNVEVWLGNLLKAVQNSIHCIIRQAFYGIEDSAFKMLEFQSMFPAQVGLLGIQMIWTRDSEVALKNAKTDRKIMQVTNQRFLDMLNELIGVTTRDLTKMDRVKYETLVTIHVHQRDIFDDLVHMHIKSVSDFEWLKQSRFYFQEDTDLCIVSITDVNFEYQNEYLGCTDRLVITPLTDRCYITLAQALGMSLGASPAGPAGTGKTETTKDMGKCLGKYVVVFNCSDQMDYRGLGRIYKGLAQSGSWGCFDEFNRIELPVLSVAAQQIAIVLGAKKDRKKAFIFTDGDNVTLNPEFGLFLTMNPGYAGRQELPENLKINFRLVAMMVPDRQIIMRVKLASCGFVENVQLSRKFYTLYKLCEEQLTKQVHYDFGLRNILSVLRTLGATKRSSPGDSEMKIVMRILRDMNLSKLVDEDEPLFLSLINDLFPGIQLEKAGYPKIEAAIEHQALEMGLVYHPPWVLKLIQLYETQRVRHGMMTLGPSGAGKTACIHVLMKAMAQCGSPHREMRMNPKAITASQMFGSLDVATNDWTDGIFSTLWRRTHKAKKGENVWLVLDGPVDAIWIENLNSVLDDNKTLTLANGDRIPMAPNCKIIFEPHNIDNASPATVSRNGMVYMSSSILNWNPILTAWLKGKPTVMFEVLMPAFEGPFVALYRYVENSLVAKMSVLECMYVQQMLLIMQGLLPDTDEGKTMEKTHLERLFVFCMMWSLGALLELPDREKMEEFLYKYKKDNGVLNLPNLKPGAGENMFEYLVSESGEWQHWSDHVTTYDYPSDSTPEYLSILVPNVDNVRMDYLMHTVMKQEKAVLLIGEQGTAKTVIVKGYMNTRYNIEVHATKAVNFSSATTPLMFQRTIESYVDKRVGTTYGPPAGKKMTMFIDDINMPVINEWGDQITNEIVRQLMGNKGYYNLEKPGDFTNIVDIQFVAAMIQPGGGRNDIPQRLKRQFTIFNSCLPSNSSIDKIFKTIGCGHFCEPRGFNQEVCSLIPMLVTATRRLWQAVKGKMLPTPAKFHYVFNLRDLSRIWQGMLTIESEVTTSIQVVMLLWKHECTRVIADRFVGPQDEAWFHKAMKQVVIEEVGQDMAAHVAEEPFFVNFLRDAPEATGEEDDDAGFEAPKIYEPIESLEQLGGRLEVFQASYNELIRGASMDLVFFRDAMIHLLKISRILNTSRGNALLVGVGGSGKQSLTRLASFIAGFKTFQITLTRSYGVSNLMDDLKVLYRTAGQEGHGITFIFTDNEIKDEAFLEYLNNVLASGEVSNLFARDEIDEITQELVPVMKKEYPRRPPTNENLYDYFLSRVKSNLHVVLCFSPVGEKFRSRSMKFPGLISGCTIDWFARWPRDALVAVARHFISSFDITCTPEVKQSLYGVMGAFQDLVAEACTDYFERFRRQTYVTPKSYLSFLNSYKSIYKEKLDLIGNLAHRMNTGLNKLIEATQSVNELSKELVEKEKELVVASKKADDVLAEVTVSAQAAEKVKSKVQTVKDKAQGVADMINADKSVAEEKLIAAKPALAMAEAALQTIKPADIATVRKLGKPPHLIMRIMDCVLLLMRRKINKIEQDPERPCVKPSWAEALKLMNDSKFLTMLLEFPKDSITGEMVDLLEPYLNQEDYTFESAKKVCGNVAGLLSWTEAMATFYAINREVLPLKANLVVQERRLAVAMGDLAEAQAILDEKQSELDAVQAVYDNAMKSKQDLIDDAEACKQKMNNAKALIGGLGGEKIRWTEASRRFQQEINRLVGDVLLCCGFLSYSGPFKQEFRLLLIGSWKKEMRKNKIPFNESLDVTSMLVDSNTINEWNLQGLPSDGLSVQNGIIVTKAGRYPLLIDPQTQGKTWIKRREKENNLQITSLNHKYFRTHLEDSLSLGRPLLVEDIGEEIDPVLDNVLEKNFIKSGSTFKVKLGDKEVDVMDGFGMFLSTKLANPAYTPEVSARTSIVDFTVTMKGLEDQLLARVIVTEKQELEAERIELLEDVTKNKRKMQELEDNLLFRLTSTEGSLVEDHSLIQVLQVTKTTAEEVSEKLTVAEETEQKISTAREEYRPVASRGSILYFLITEMSLVNVMYQTSLAQFLQVFDHSIQRSSKSPIPAKRISNIIDYLTFAVFCYTARGLYEEHKFLFTLLLALKIDIQAGRVSNTEFDVLIKGGAALDMNSVEPKPKKWILDVTWLNLVRLAQLPQFKQITSQISSNDKSWKSWFDEEAPEECDIPEGYTKSLDVFRKFLLIRSWCPDRTMAMARYFILDSLGKRYADGVTLNLELMYEESDNHTPMICLLSMGSDPTDQIERLAKKLAIRCQAISMGQGQEVHARRLLQQATTEGGWVLFQNCHLGLMFMEELLESIQTLPPETHPTMRVYITTEVNDKFPITLLQMSTKFTNEPPQGMKAGLKRTYAGVTQEQLEVTNMPQWRPLLYTTAFLHSVVQERRKFGPLGWNIPYEFNQSDFTASVQFIQNHLDDIDPKKGVSFKTINYMIGEVNYGGRVTDDYDKRLLNTFCKVWFGEQMFDAKFSFFAKGGYVIPRCSNVADYRLAIENLPDVDSPEVFGLHPNADITYQTNTANQVFTTTQSIQPKDSGGGSGETRESVVERLATEMLEKLPPDYRAHEVKERIVKMGISDPLNIFLRQEVDRMQKVIACVRTTLTDLQLAIEGTIIMNEALRCALDSIFDAQVPAAWTKISWDSATIGFWFTGLLDRNAQFHTWLFDGKPNQFWMTGFFNPQGFLTAMRQEITRHHQGWALDGVVLHNEITKMLKEDVTCPPNEGVYVYGLFLDGAGWDKRNTRLIEPANKVLFANLPVAHVFAINASSKDSSTKCKSGYVFYDCPVYKKPRRTDLTYIFPLKLNTTVAHGSDRWTLRGVALLCDTK
uniref:dynein heavy chain 5, axonemal-like isoform X1 n=2 Tax=Ciona intestinalis TaxID=7719 RepID=UPI00089DC38B|nr:dynein heavy chain 5, axonemal-like isoform X1 [Ciona intestinalis]XP_026692815.1 dynein heavy chain 5, axonemal-like isoform X1 [Ciona intestinalis]|eukprot:XP_018669928.1 dynein heavy chain 5, axonemal-like isoform X1 [Ciona intestinalis]